MNAESLKIGDYLKKIRLDKGVELELIAKDTRISLNVLKDLENSKLDALPGQTYVSGFVTNYLKYLKVDHQEAIRILKQSYDGISQPEEVYSEQEPEGSNNGITFDIHTIVNKKIIIVSITVILIFGLYQIFNHLLSENYENSTAITEVENLDAPEIPDNDEQGLELVVSTTTTTKAPTTSTSSTTTSTTLVSKLPTDFPFVKFKKIKKAFYTIDSLDASAEIPPEYRSKGDGKNTLYVRASFGNCWVRYKVDDKKIKGFILKEGRELHLTGNTFFLNFGSIGNVEVFYNDKVVDAPSKTGFKLMILPKEEAINHEYPIFVDSKKNISYFYSEYKEKMDPEEISEQ